MLIVPFSTIMVKATFQNLPTGRFAEQFPSCQLVDVSVRVLIAASAQVYDILSVTLSGAFAKCVVLSL